MSEDPLRDGDGDKLEVGASTKNLGLKNDNRSPSFSPPLLDSGGSSGSPAGSSRRHGSTGEKGRKDREERIRMIRERQEQERERRLSELRATQEREEKMRQQKEVERDKRVKELRARDTTRRHAVEERRKMLEEQDDARRKLIMTKYKEYEEKNSLANRAKRPVYAFGSSTPRTLAYLEHLDNSQKIYNTRLHSANGPSDGCDDAASPTATSSVGSKRAVSAFNLNRRPLSSKRPGSVMTMSMHVSNPAPTNHPHVAHRDLLSPNHAALASASMTASFAAGVSPLNNVRRHPPSSSRSQSTPRIRPATSSSTLVRKIQVIVEETESASRRKTKSKTQTTSNGPSPITAPKTQTTSNGPSPIAAPKTQTTSNGSSPIPPKVLSNAQQNGEEVQTAVVPERQINTEEQAKAAMAERRRMMHEQMERDKELERQREEQRRIEEEERLRREEEEFRRQEEEELRALEEARLAEQERLRLFMEEQRLRQLEEDRKAEEEKRRQIEAEVKAREQAERAERERKEIEEKQKREEEERLERKKKLDAIMQRTRQPGSSNNLAAKAPSNQNSIIETSSSINTKSDDNKTQYDLDTNKTISVSKFAEKVYTNGTSTAITISKDETVYNNGTLNGTSSTNNSNDEDIISFN